jgi:hypothetical protein
MPNFKCKNKRCKSFDKEVYRNKISFKFNEETKKFDIPFGKQSYCDECRQTLEFVEPKEKKIPKIYLTDFKQLPTEEKKKVLKKRANEHSEKKMKDKIHEVKRKFGI